MFRPRNTLCLLLLLLALPAAASAHPRQAVDRDLDYGHNAQTGADRLGVFVANRPGGLYMGRLFTGDPFNAVGGSFTSRKGTKYFRARALGDVDACAWVGPSIRVDDQTRWQKPAGEDAAGCDASVLDWLGTDRGSFNDGSALYSHVNCPPPSTEDHNSIATFGGYAHTTKPTPVFHNLKWRWTGVRYESDQARGSVGEIPTGTGVFYRYTTNGGKFANVFFDGNSGSYGWAFVEAEAIPRVNYWTPAKNPPVYHSYSCDSKSLPGTPVIAPWPLWLALGGQSTGTAG